MPFPLATIVWGFAALHQAEWEAARPGSWMAEKPRTRQDGELCPYQVSLEWVPTPGLLIIGRWAGGGT